MTVEEGAFTITSTVNSNVATVGSIEPSMSKEIDAINCPGPRFGAAMAVKQGMLYLYGGTIEEGEVTYALKDFYCLG